MDVDRSLGDKFVRVNMFWVDIDVSATVGSGDGEISELKYAYEVCSGDENSVNKIFKCNIFGARGWVRDSIGWCVDSGVGYGVGSSNETIYEFDNGYILGYYVVYFVVLNHGKPVVSFLDKSLE